jgi:TonB family protein
MRLLAMVWLIAVFVTAVAQEPTTPSTGASIHIRTLHSPMPDYPYSLRSKGRAGVGIFVLHVDTKTGWVTLVDVEKSTGSAAFDETSVYAFRHWRFQPPISPRVRISAAFDASGKVGVLVHTP